MEDALDFDQQIDKSETEIVKKSGIGPESVARLLKHRVALGIITYPRAAAYLVSHYERLEGRVFEKTKFTELGKRWYEYHRARDARLMLAKPRILSPTLMRTVRFVLDEVGYLSDHACLMIQPTQKTNVAWEDFEKKMKSIVGEKLSKKELLRYCLAFMNSSYAQNRLVTGHRPTPKGSYTITEAFLKEIPIPVSTDKKATKTIIKLVEDLERPGPGKQQDPDLEQKLREVVQKLLDPIKA